MSSTNKTSYYNLSQYIGNDKPTYLGDYNSDMSKIDEGIHSAVETATTANQTAGSAEAKATKANNDLSALDKRVVDNTRDIDQLEANYTALRQDVTGVQNTASQAQQTATNAYNLIQNAHFTNFEKVKNVNTKITLDASRPLMCAYSAELELLILTGGFNYNANVSAGEILFTLPNFVKKPSATRKINYFGNAFSGYTAGSGFNYVSPQTLQIDGNGNILQKSKRN